MGDRASSYIECALDYSEAGYYADAVFILECCPKPTPMVWYHLACFAADMEDWEYAKQACYNAAAADPYCCLPNRLEDIAALEYAVDHNLSDARAYYYLGCLWYDKRQYDDAIICWERSAAINESFPTVWRNLSLAYYNKRHDSEKARTCMERAYALDESDARVLLELYQLCGKLNYSITDRFALLDAHREIAFTRDDLYTEYCTLLNDQGRYQEALDLLIAHKFHPWEGGEGKVTTQYAVSLTQLGIQALDSGDAAKAKELLEKALVFPYNLGEGKLEGAKDNNIHYYLGLAENALGNEAESLRHLELAAAGNEEPGSAMYYNDQPADMILYEGLAGRALGRKEKAADRFRTLISYGEKHCNDEVKIDYFAVSLPDLQLFEDDLSVRNRAHCEYLIALGSYGLGDKERAARCFDAVLKVDQSHQGAILHRKLL